MRPTFLLHGLPMGILLLLDLGCQPLEPTIPDPVLLSVSPDAAAPGEVVELAGEDFGPRTGRSAVLLTPTDGTAQVDVSSGVTRWTEEAITLLLLVDVEPGEYRLTVRRRDLISNSLAFTVQSERQPTIASIAPTAAQVGDPVTISGRNFGDDVGRVVFTPEVEGLVTVWSDTEIEVEVPEGAEDGDVYVETAAGAQSAGVEFQLGELPSNGDEPTLTRIQDDIFTPICAVSECHGAARESGLSLREGRAYSNLVDVPSRSDPSILRVDPGQPDRSFLVEKISNISPSIGDRMPLERSPLTDQQIQLIVDWISEGALDN